MTAPQLVPDRRSPPSAHEPIAQSPSMVEAFSRAHAFAPAATPVLLYGESGVGKTFFAQFIHELSGRADGFHDLGLGSLTPQLAADELFGHVPGAFTDARGSRVGRIAAAGRGTLLLDDLRTLDLDSQKRLLKVFDRGTYTAVGSDRIQTAACRFIVAMTGHPDALMENGELYEDLRYRFGDCAIEIPPLRNRREEIPLHARRALDRCPVVTGATDGPTVFSAAALELLMQGEYKGNIRRLEGIVLCAYLLARDEHAAAIDVAHLPADLKHSLAYTKHGDRDANRAVVRRVLELTGGSVTKAAQLLGVSRETIRGAGTKK